MKSIVILANKYPNPFDPTVNVFTQQTAWTFAELGIRTIVICPMPVNGNKKYKELPFIETETSENGFSVDVYRPKYFSLGQRKGFGRKLRVSVTTKTFTKAVDSVLQKLEFKPDVLFGEFLCPAGVTAALLGKKYGVDSYFQHGEAIYVGDEKYGNEKLKKLLSNLTGVVAVSGQNKGFIADAGIVDEAKIAVFPNGCRKTRFYKRDKIEAREKLGWDKDKFIVGYCGSFDDRKGILRLEKAVDGMDDVYFACAGKGSLMPTSEKCIMAKSIDNAELPWFYSALDAFVFPTYHEGCCTAIVEAILCGCPIVSSDRSFNYEICDETNSILVEPDDIKAIQEAVEKIKSDENLKAELSSGSLKKAEWLNLEARITGIAEHMGLN
ncbi:MAG: glycosyltransferase [Clostridia bacterium]|nr:glycosyltransferase [Clostridia bacterium]